MPETRQAHIEPPILAVDFGERRIGLAISDDAGRIALPLQTLERTTDRRAIYQIAEIASSRGVQSLIVGEPRHIDGGPSPNLPRVRRFAERLADVASLPLFWIEETLSTAEADRRIGQRGTKPRRGDKRLDMIAAQIILEDGLALSTEIRTMETSD